MAVVSSTTSSTYVASSEQAPAASPAGSLAGDDFMMLLLAQMRNQNPLEPMDDKALMGQITQLNSLQELQKISATLLARNKTSELSEASELIGKTVTFAAGEGEIATGVVTGISLVDNQISLLVGEWMVPVEALITVE